MHNGAIVIGRSQGVDQGAWKLVELVQISSNDVSRYDPDKIVSVRPTLLVDKSYNGSSL